MMPIISNPKEALIQSYTQPVAYKNLILFNGIVIVRYVSKGEKRC
jgi:hypothetical protein